MKEEIIALGFKFSHSCSCGGVLQNKYIGHNHMIKHRVKDDIAALFTRQGTKRISPWVKKEKLNETISQFLQTTA